MVKIHRLFGHQIEKKTETKNRNRKCVQDQVIRSETGAGRERERREGADGREGKLLSIVSL